MGVVRVKGSPEGEDRVILSGISARGAAYSPRGVFRCTGAASREVRGAVEEGAGHQIRPGNLCGGGQYGKFAGRVEGSYARVRQKRSSCTTPNAVVPGALRSSGARPKVF